MSRPSYDESWLTHAKCEGWTKFVIPPALIDEARKVNPYYPEHVAAVQICRAEGIPYGHYVTAGNVFYVDPEVPREESPNAG